MKQEIKVGFDMASFIWRGLLAGKDAENGRRVLHDDKEVWINSGNYGYNNVVNMMLEVMDTYKVTPIDCVLVFEGISSKSKRLLISSDYKAGRESRAPQAYESFEECKQMLLKAFLDMGATAVTQDYAEGDDTLAYLAEHSEVRFIVATYDGDMTKLNTKRNAYGAEVEAWIGGLRGVNKYGNFAPHLVTAYKALVGDGNEYPGCKGFGPGAFEKFLEAFGEDGLQQFQDMCERSSLDELHAMEHPLIAKICASEEQVLMSYELAKLRPEWVNTLQHPLQIRAGMVAIKTGQEDDRLSKWYGNVWLVTAKEFAAASEFVKQHLNYSPYVTLDIETSTPDESDEWLARCGNPEGVDVFGAELTGLGLTFGDNNQYTMYFSVDHTETNNCSSKQVCELIASIKHKIVIQNVSYELTVLKQAWGEWMAGNGFNGFLPNVLDTAIEASYVDENNPRGLKDRSMSVLGYKQETYKEVTTLSGRPEDLPDGGRLLESVTDAEGTVQKRSYKMRELPATHVLSYGADDTRCTAALHNYYKFVMQLEHTYDVYEMVEIPAAYMHAEMFLTGITFSLETMQSLVSEDDKTYDQAWATVRDFLIANSWEGTVPPVYGTDIKLADVKSAYTIVTGKTLDTLIRTPAKLVTFIRDVAGDAVFAGMLERCYTDEAGAASFTAYVQSHYKNEPIFNDGSTTQMQHLMYTVMGLPVRVRNKVTDAARARGEREGTAKTDALAINYALRDAKPEHKAVLDALKLMAMVGTRRSLYYNKYPSLLHWKDGKIHSNHNQCAANTRRATSSGPNVQQQPKHPKIEGHASRFRETIVPHHKQAVIVSLDFDGQELRVIADYSKDPNMVACYVGDNKKGLHELTGLSIYNRTHTHMSYEEYIAVLHDDKHELFKEAKESRVLGKKTNFTSEYGAMAPKLAQTLMVSESDAQLYLDARESTFHVAAKWKLSVVAEAREKGYVTTKLGARRHLAEALFGNDRWISSKAERQAVNFKIQSSSAEMTKLAEGRMFKAGLTTKYDCQYIGPIHDEAVWSVAISDLFEFLVDMHTCMVAKYADMEIPIETGISFGPNFYQQIEIGTQPTLEAVQAGVEKLVEKYHYQLEEV